MLLQKFSFCKYQNIILGYLKIHLLTLKRNIILIFEGVMQINRVIGKKYKILHKIMHFISNIGGNASKCNTKSIETFGFI